MSRGRARGNGEGSFYPVQGGYRGYVWCTSAAGELDRKYVKSKPTRTPSEPGSNSAMKPVTGPLLPMFQLSSSFSGTG